jgi:hypothetical protein
MDLRKNVARIALNMALNIALNVLIEAESQCTITNISIMKVVR